MVVPNETADPSAVDHASRHHVHGMAAVHRSGVRTMNGTIRLVRERIARGTMPPDLDKLIDLRGSLDNAAVDLAQFTGETFGDCLAALEVVYDPTH
jgi:hypothetical protein